MVRKLQGLYFEDYKMGGRFETPGRTLTDALISTYAGVSADFNSLHIDDEYAKDTIYGQRIAHGMLTLTIGIGLLERLGLAIGTGMGFLGMKETKFLKPVPIGDTIRTEAEVIHTRSTSKPDRGIVSLKLNIINQRGETVCETEMIRMVKRKGF